MPLPFYSFRAEVNEEGAGRRFVFAADWPGAPPEHAEIIRARGQHDYLDMFARMAAVLGTRSPRNRRLRRFPPAQACHRALLTENLTDRMLYGYGDPCIVHDAQGGGWWAVVTSNDAPDSFPILRSAALTAWELAGFVFPQGSKPSWAADGLGRGDFWAPELHKLGDRYLLCFAAREHDGSMSVGIATARSPAGPFVPPDRPLLRGGVIDAHVFVPEQGNPILFWKEDTNAVWPEHLVALLGDQPETADLLFTHEEDRRTARVAAAIWQTAHSWPPMERFFVLQPLIEAVVDRYAEVRRHLASLPGPVAAEIVAAMQTPIFAQPLTPEGTALIGERKIVLVNDLEWEAHLIEGPWLTAANGAYYLFYSGNDFSTNEYGIGVAIGASPMGPFRKMPLPLLRSDEAWQGPGHPSVAPGPGGEPHLFYHAFRPGEAGYNAFRSLLTARLSFSEGRVEVCR